jgi:hypothetical protein
MVPSDHSDAPRGMEFLYSANRLNVATSRAKCVCVVVASPRLFEAECRTPARCSWLMLFADTSSWRHRFEGAEAMNLMGFPMTMTRKQMLHRTTGSRARDRVMAGGAQGTSVATKTFPNSWITADLANIVI